MRRRCKQLQIIDALVENWKVERTERRMTNGNEKRKEKREKRVGRFLIENSRTTCNSAQCKRKRDSAETLNFCTQFSDCSSKLLVNIRTEQRREILDNR